MREPSPVAPRTRRRWRRRLESDAHALVEALSLDSGALVGALIGAIGLDARRIEVVGHYRTVSGCAAGGALAELAAWVHRLVPGIRLM